MKHFRYQYKKNLFIVELANKKYLFSGIVRFWEMANLLQEFVNLKFCFFKSYFLAIGLILDKNNKAMTPFEIKKYLLEQIFRYFF